MPPRRWFLVFIADSRVSVADRDKNSPLRLARTEDLAG